MKFDIRHLLTIAAIALAAVCVNTSSHHAADTPAVSCGAPNFALPAPLLPTRGLSRFVAGDFNGDGRVDLVTRSFTDRAMLTFAAGNSAGGFDSPISSPLDIQFVAGAAMDAADFNKDGKLDIVIQAGAQKIYILLGDGSGRFATPVAYQATPQGGHLLIADFNQDGNADIATASDFAPQMTVLLGTGTGGFLPEMPFSLTGAGSFTEAIGAGDFTGDGKPDLIYLGHGDFRFFLLANDGTGKFGTATPVSFIDQTVQGVVSPRSLGIADVTGDGKLDVVVTSDKGLSVVAGNGAGGFAEAKMYLRDSSSHNIYLGDFNGDGRADIAVSPGTDFASGAGPDVTLLLSMGDGMFAEPAHFVTGARGKATALDFNGDGLKDLLMTAPALISSQPITGFIVVRGDRQKGLAALRLQPVNVVANSTAMGDLNGDGSPDLVVAYGLDNNSSGVAVFRGDGAGGFGSPVTYPAMRPAFVAIRDFTRDGKPDIAVANEGGNNVTILINDGGGNFTSSRQIATATAPRSLGIGDFTNDGKLDLILSGNASDLVLMAGGDNAAFTPLTTGIAAGLYPSVFAIGDYDGDGNLDLAVLATNPTSLCQQATDVAILSGDGRGGFAESRRVRFPDAVNTLVSADLNGDGRADLISGNPCDLSSGGIAILLSAPGGGFAAPARYPVEDARRILSSDINGDGKPDLIADNLFGEIVILTNTGDGSFITPVRLGLGEARNLSLGDVNKDGTTDLVVFKNLAASGSLVSVPNFTRCSAFDGAAAASAASFFTHQLASESIAALFGSELATEVKAPSSLPLPTTLAGASVKVRDSAGVERLAPLFFASPGQINFQMPPDTALGVCLLTVAKPDGRFAVDTVEARATAPGIFSADSTGKGYAAALALRVKSDGAQIYEPVVRYDAAQRQFVAVPIDLSVASDQVYLVLFGTGLRFNGGPGAVTARVDGVDVAVSYVGAQSQFIGLDQVNLLLPNSLAGKGEAEIMLTVDGKAANTTSVKIK